MGTQQISGVSWTKRTNKFWRSTWRSFYQNKIVRFYVKRVKDASEVSASFFSFNVMICSFVLIDFVPDNSWTFDWPSSFLSTCLSLRHWRCANYEWATTEWLCISFLLISLKLLSTSELRHQLRLCRGQRHSQILQQSHHPSYATTSTHSKILFSPIAISWRVSALLWT